MMWLNRLRWLALLLPLLPGAASALAPAAVIVVTNANDSGAGTLRQAILDSNASAGVIDQITFNVPGAGPHTITLITALPDITDPVTIDGTTQPGYAQTPLIEVDGTAIAAPNAVLTLSAGDSTITGLALNRGPDVGIRIRTAGRNKIRRCFIGTDPSGTIDRGNGSHGVSIEQVSNNEIGSAFLGQRCVIAGNGGHGVFILGPVASSNFVSDCSVGTNLSRTLRLGNDGWGVTIENASDNGVELSDVFDNGNGGVNILAGSSGSGIALNSIGAIAVGTPTLGNHGPGISAASGTIQTIERNTVAGTGGPGIEVLAPATGVKVTECLLFGNVGPEIDLGGDGRTANDDLDADVGANNLQNHPVLSAFEILSDTGAGYAGYLKGYLQGVPSTNYTLDIFPGTVGNGQDDSQVTGPPYSPSLSFSTDAAGLGTIVSLITLPRGTTVLTATVRDSGGNTSELSPPLLIKHLVADSGCGAIGVEWMIAMLLGAALRRRQR